MTPSSRVHSMRVHRQFERDAQTYNAHADVQEQVAESLMSLARARALRPPERILEAGCGTGLLTRRILEAWPAARLTALDLSATMIRQAHEALEPDGANRVQWIESDLASWRPDRHFDAVLSSSTLHWVPSLDRALRTLRQACRPGGFAAFSLFLEGTLGELHAVRRRLVPSKQPRTTLPAFAAVQTALDIAGWRTEQAETRDFIRAYPSPEALLRQLRDQGVNAGYAGGGGLTRGELERVCRLYRERAAHPGGVRATFRAGFFVATNPREAPQ